MKLNRSLMLPLLAALAVPSVALAGGNNTKSGFGYFNALLGSNRTDVYMDGKAVYRNAREGRTMKPKVLGSEGYAIQVNAAKIGFSYLDFTYNLVPGREYTLIPMGNLAGPEAPQALMIDRPSLIVPKYGSHVVFAVAMPDSPPVDFFIDGQPQAVDVPAQGYSNTIATGEGKHVIELKIDNITIYGPQKVKLKKGQTTTFVVYGTLQSGDKYPIKVEDIVSKGL